MALKLGFMGFLLKGKEYDGIIDGPSLETTNGHMIN